MVSSGFPSLDSLGGGFTASQAYLVHGPLGSGKTTFALQFIMAGLRAGEPTALVTRRSAPVLLDRARAFGFELEPFVRTGRLALFEYAPRVIESCTRLRDDAEIVEELRAGLADPPTRIVLDPVTPLLAGISSAGAAFRARALVQGFAQLGAVTLLLCDTPEDQDAAAGFRDLVHGSLRFEAAVDGSPARIVPQQLVGGRLAPVEFEVERGTGLVAARRGALGPGVGARTVLLIIRDEEERAGLAGLLASEHRVEQAHDAAAGLARMSAAAPDLVLIEEQAGSIGGAEFCRQLRANGLNVPIVLVADRVRRVRDRVALLGSGADECLERPVDPRLLKLKVRALLGRYDGRRDRLAGPRAMDATAPTERDGVTSTRDSGYFEARVMREAESARALAVPFAIVGVRSASAESARQAGTAIQKLVREYDLVWLGGETSLVLLAETDENGVRAFADRLSRSGAPAAVLTRRFFFDPVSTEDTAVATWLQEQLRDPGAPTLLEASHA